MPYTSKWQGRATTSVTNSYSMAPWSSYTHILPESSEAYSELCNIGINKSNKINGNHTFTFSIQAKPHSRQQSQQKHLNSQLTVLLAQQELLVSMYIMEAVHVFHYFRVILLRSTLDVYNVTVRLIFKHCNG